MWTASALKRNCAYPNILKKLSKPTPKQRKALGQGVAFHALAEAHVRGHEIAGAIALADDDVRSMIERLIAEWHVPPGAQAETAWGLTLDGKHAHVSEPKPHVYVPMTAGVELLTAGRSDVDWREGGCLAVVDWKTGTWAADEAKTNLQVHSAGTALAQRRGCSSYLPGLYYARTGAWDWGSVVEIGSPEHAEILDGIRAAALLPETAQPGPHCDGCWEKRKKTCAEAA